MKHCIAISVLVWFGLLAAVGSSGDLHANASNRILFLMQAGNTDVALKSYRAHVEQLGHHDLELIQQMGVGLLEQGSRSSELEVQVLTLFGAGIAIDEKVLYILEDGLRSPQPQLQLIALNFLTRYQSDRADEMIGRAMSSNYLPIRLEAVYQMALKKMPAAVGQIEALMSKVDPELHPLFPQLFALVGTSQATRILRRLMSHPNEGVRIAAVLSAAKAGRDDLLPGIRILATHHAAAQQEACATALGILKDEVSVPRLEILAGTGMPTVRLAALQALYRLGRHNVRADIESIAREGDPFAIMALGEIPGSEDALFKLTEHPNINVRANAALSLLKSRDVRCLKPLCEFLIKDSRDLAITEVTSQGQSLNAVKVIPSAQQNCKEDPSVAELTLNAREEIIHEALVLSENDFLRLAHTLFEARQNDLVPALVEALEKLQSANAIALLKLHQQKTGAPLIRNYCNLALFRLKEEGPYADNLRSWVAAQRQEELIRFRPVLPWSKRGTSSTYQLTPDETSRLLVEALEAFAQSQESKGIDVLIDAIQYGNVKNKYALAGLLIRAAQ